MYKMEKAVGVGEGKWRRSTWELCELGKSARIDAKTTWRYYFTLAVLLPSPFVLIGWLN